MRKGIISAGLSVVWLLGITQIDARSADPTPEEQEVRKAAAAYAEAFNAGNVEAVLALWSDDADYVDDTGAVYKGKEAIARLVKRNFENPRRSKLAVEVTGIRFPAADVAIEDGTLRVIDSAGNVESTRYTGVWVKKDGNWRLSTVRDLVAPAAATAEGPSAQLAQLEWLTGEWTHEEGDVKVNISCQWTLQKKFLLLRFQVARKGSSTPIDVEQMIGANPITGQIRSWVFDSHGGFGDGSWTREGNVWTITASGILPNGQEGLATNVIHFIDDQSFGWKSLNRQIAGQPVPDTEIKFTRVSGK